MPPVRRKRGAALQNVGTKELLAALDIEAGIISEAGHRIGQQLRKLQFEERLLLDMLERAGGSDDGDDGDAALATPSAAPLLAPASAHPAAARVSADEENATRKVPSRPDGRAGNDNSASPAASSQPLSAELVAVDEGEDENEDPRFTSALTGFVGSQMLDAEEL